MIAKYIKVKGKINVETSVSMDGIPINKLKQYQPYTASIIAKNKEICNITKRQQQKTEDTTYKFDDEEIIVKVPQGKSNIQDLENIMEAFKNAKENGFDGKLNYIYDINDNEIGYFQQVVVTKQKPFLNNYQYNIMGIKDLTFYVYHYASFKEGSFLCVYDEKDNLIGMVKRDKTTKNEKDTYNIFMKDNKWYKYLCIITDQWHDNIYESEYSLDGITAVKTRNENTISKIIATKYDPTFINEVIDSEPEADRVENMSLVKEKTKEAQRTPDIMIKYILLFLTFLVVLVVFLINYFK